MSDTSIPAECQIRYLAIKVMMMPRDTNPHGTIFGGVLLSHIDQAGAAGAQYFIRCAGWPDHHVVTVAMDKVEFHRSVHVGDVVSFWTEVRHIGRTSIAMHVRVEADRNGEVHQLTDADVTYVAFEASGEERVPVPIRGQ
ncbi:MAG: acyl-CoA thioesterase [Candidatus Latescibacterota bacterium]